MHSNLDYAKYFKACEAEDLRHPGSVQSGFKMAILSDDGRIARAACSLDEDEIRALAGSKAVRQIGKHHALIEREGGEKWVRHRRGNLAILEAPIHANPSHFGRDEFDPGEVLRKAHGNLSKLSFALTSWAANITGAERCMVYKFHDDWCGEVIAEVVAPTLEPYLGLRYPPTDIPKMARELYVETGSRHLFSTTRGNIPLEGQITGEELDLSHAFSRSVSPYHIEYLRNMGTASTSSTALIHDGKLWGLLSIHYGTDRLPCLTEFETLQRVSGEFGQLLAKVLVSERVAADNRMGRMMDNFRARLASTMEPFSVLLNSSASLHRMLAAQGLVVIVDAEYAAAGNVLSARQTFEILEKYCSQLDAGEFWSSDCLSEDCPDLGTGDVAGAFVMCICRSPATYVIATRVGITQTVSWGGDPRRVGIDDEDQRVNPRKSFAKWVETVEGRAAAWSTSNEAVLTKAINIVCEEFDVAWHEVAVLLRTGMRRMARRKDFVRQNALDTIEGIRTAIAIGAEVSANAEGSVMALNASACDAFAISPAEAVGMSLSEFEQMVGVPLLDHGTKKVTTTVTTVDAGIRNCEIDIGLLFCYENGRYETIRIQSFELRDVTESRRVQDALRAIRDKVVRERKLREEYFAKLSHELRTPLNILLGISELLRVDPDLGEPRARKVQSINTAARHMSDLIENTLEEARFAHGRDDEELCEVELGPIIGEVVELLQRHLTQDGIAVVYDAHNSASALGDARAIRQILFNVLGNAGKFNVPNGTITVSVEEESDFVTIRVVDTGIGMSPDELTSCRDPYMRFGNRPGSGLGLSISQKLTEAMGGTIEIQSKIGEGTEVRIILRKHQAAHIEVVTKPRTKGQEAISEAIAVLPDQSGGAAA